MFKKYPKIYHLGKEETEGILSGTVHIEEKLDGANTSVWLDTDGKLHCASRNREITDGEFFGFVDYIQNNEQIQALLKDHPEYRLYGEWLVRHTVKYKETAYMKFYLFDITIITDDEINEKFLPRQQGIEIADKYNIPRPAYYGAFDNPTIEQIQQFVGKSELGEVGEGVVLKNDNFINKFGNHCYAKVVSEQFRENRAIIFSGNSKNSPTYWEMYVINKYITLPRVQKIMDKLQPQLNERLDKKHTPQIVRAVYHDMLTEEIWDIQQKVQKLDFQALKRLATKKIARIYHDILDDTVSVAFQDNQALTTDTDGI